MVSSNRYDQLADILLDLEMALRRCNLWESVRPSEEALQSDQPFCIDTLQFSQWLQFVFIERLKAMIETQATLPTQSAIVAIAEENFTGVAYDTSAIVSCLARFDAMIEAR